MAAIRRQKSLAFVRGFYYTCGFGVIQNFAIANLFGDGKMKRYGSISTIFVIGCILLLAGIGCNRQAEEPAPPRTVVTVPDVPNGPVEVNTVVEDVKKKPKIKFDKVIHDFGKVGPGSTHRCEFRFKNIGDGTLRITKPKSQCTCTIGQLTKTEYAPGESGVIKVTKFHVPKRQGQARQPLIVTTNDETMPTVKLIVQAQVVLKVTHAPKRLKLLLKDENAGCPEITLRSTDDQPFAIRGFSATGRAITADYDSSVSAKTHTIQPKVNISKLRRRLSGNISIKLTHPGCKDISIPFEVLAMFTVDPASIFLYNVKPGEPNEKIIWLLNNYGEDFEVESVSSERGLIKLLKQERIGKRYKFVLEITPPDDTGKRLFTDVFHINVEGGEKLKVNCNGFYPKS